jgi:hypothetical protein
MSHPTVAVQVRVPPRHCDAQCRLLPLDAQEFDEIWRGTP